MQGNRGKQQKTISKNKKKLHDAKSGEKNRVSLQNLHEGELKIATWNIKSLINLESLECVKKLDEKV